jgi:hypothetical protein
VLGTSPGLSSPLARVRVESESSRADCEFDSANREQGDLGSSRIALNTKVWDSGSLNAVTTEPMNPSPLFCHKKIEYRANTDQWSKSCCLAYTCLIVAVGFPQLVVRKALAQGIRVEGFVRVSGIPKHSAASFVIRRAAITCLALALS